MDPDKIMFYKECCDPDLLHTYPRAVNGATKVYYPPMAPEIVIKESGLKSFFRLNNMEKVKRIIDQIGATFLIVPNAIVYDRWLIEDKVYGISDTVEDNIAKYVNNLKFFDNVVDNFIQLAEYVTLTDFISHSASPKSNIQGALGAVRYDNLPLIINRNSAYVALIDLEYVNFSPSQVNKQDFLRNLLKMFPFHSSQFTKLLSSSDVEKYSTAGKIYINRLYTEYRAWKKTPTKKHSLIYYKIVFAMVERIKRLNLGINRYYKLARFVGMSPRWNVSNPVSVAVKLTKKYFGVIDKLIARHGKCSIVLKRSLFVLRLDEIYYTDLLLCFLKEIKGRDIFNFDIGIESGGHDLMWLQL